jgi:hypothetical protein
LLLTPEQQKIEEEALDFARKHKKSIAKRLTDPTRFLPEDEPV